MSASVRRNLVLCSVAGSAAVLGLLAACASFDSTPTDAGGADAATTETGTPVGDGGGADAAATETGVGTDGGMPSCELTSVPATAVKMVSISFQQIDTGGSAELWKSLGFDRDGRCTTAASTDVCMPAAGALPSSKEDGDGGIDNAWGHEIRPIIASVSGMSAEGSGYLVTDASGTGTLVIVIGSAPGRRLIVPVRNAEVARVGSSASLSVIVPTEPFVTGFADFLGRSDLSLCSGATLDSIKAMVRQVSDLPLSGTHDPLKACDAISLGATVTGIADAILPDLDAGASPCL